MTYNFYIKIYILNKTKKILDPPFLFPFTFDRTDTGDAMQPENPSTRSSTIFSLGIKLELEDRNPKNLNVIAIAKTRTNFSPNRVVDRGTQTT
jgi:hypothetical protein